VREVSSPPVQKTSYLDVHQTGSSSPTFNA
jgi:hypothetical protein